MALTDRDTSLNYIGELFMIGANQTPFLQMIGGVGGANAKATSSMIYPMGQTWSPTAGAIPTIDEDELVTAGTADTVARAQVLNTVQIFQKYVTVSDLKQADKGTLAGLSALGNQPVMDEFGFQKMAQLKKMANDMNLAFLTGTYAAAADSSTPAQTNGIITACTTNTVAADAAKVTKAMIDALFLEMANAGAPFENIKIFCNGFNKGVLTDIYGYAPESRSVGGANITRIITNFCEADVVFDPTVPAATILVADMNYIAPVFLPNDGGMGVWYTDLARTAGAKNGMFESFAGIDYGNERFHGTLTNCATA